MPELAGSMGRWAAGSIPLWAPAYGGREQPLKSPPLKEGAWKPVTGLETGAAVSSQLPSGFRVPTPGHDFDVRALGPRGSGHWSRHHLLLLLPRRRRWWPRPCRRWLGNGRGGRLLPLLLTGHCRRGPSRALLLLLQGPVGSLARGQQGREQLLASGRRRTRWLRHLLLAAACRLLLLLLVSTWGSGSAVKCHLDHVRCHQGHSSSCGSQRETERAALAATARTGLQHHAAEGRAPRFIGHHRQPPRASDGQSSAAAAAQGRGPEGYGHCRDWRRCACCVDELQLEVPQHAPPGTLLAAGARQQGLDGALHPQTNRCHNLLTWHLRGPTVVPLAPLGLGWQRLALREDRCRARWQRLPLGADLVVLGRRRWALLHPLLLLLRRRRHWPVSCCCPKQGPELLPRQ